MSQRQVGRAYPEIHLIGITGIPEIRSGDDLVGLILEAAEAQETPVEGGDILVVTQKVVSKAEGCIVDLRQVEPSEFAISLAFQWGKDPRHVEVVLRESRRIVRMDHGVIITETKHGLICANAGVDASNMPGEDYLSLLPRDPDASARRLRETIRSRQGIEVGILISDTFGRPWRTGTTNVAIGVAGISPLKDYRGQIDPYGYQLQVTMSAVADELTGAADLVTDKMLGIPVAIVRGLIYETTADNGQVLLRDSTTDLFR